jgi:hypothetical protein
MISAGSSGSLAFPRREPLLRVVRHRTTVPPRSGAVTSGELQLP